MTILKAFEGIAFPHTGVFSTLLIKLPKKRLHWAFSEVLFDSKGENPNLEI